MADTPWPTIPVWIGNPQAHIAHWRLHFVPTPDTLHRVAVITNQPAGLNRLGAATRAAVTALMDTTTYWKAKVPLRAGHEHLAVPHPDTDPNWPKLPYRRHRGTGDRWTLFLGAPPHAESPRGIAGCAVCPFPTDFDVIWDLDLLVEDAICRVTGNDDYQAAMVQLRRCVAAQAPDPGGDYFDGHKYGGGTWLKDWAPPIPTWSTAGPRTVSGGLPGHGKRT